MCKKAIVVDGDFFFARFMAELLSERGYRTVNAYDGKEGMQALEDPRQPDLLLLDVVLPKVDGWTLIRYTKNKFPERRFPIFVVSATVIEQLDELDRIGADYYIAKGPLNQMGARIDEILLRTREVPEPGPGDRRVFELGRPYPRKESLALIASLHFQQAVTESIGLGVLVVDRDTRVLSSNTRALRLLCRSEAEVWNQPVAELFSKTERAKLIRSMKKVARNPELGQIAVALSLNGAPVRSLVTRFCQDLKPSGWIVTLEERAEEAGVLAN